MLDEKDKIIFEHLLNDCRTPVTYLSKITNLTKPTVLYRIHKLEKEGYISKYDAILNHSKIFENTQLIFVKVQKDKEEEFEEAMLKNRQIASIYRLIGKYNYFILANINTGDMKQFEIFLEKMALEYKMYDLKKMDFLPFSIFDIPIIYKPKESKKKIQTDKPLKIDKADIQIIKVLTDGGGRSSILELSKKTGIKYDTVLYRFKRFKKENLFPLFIAQPGTRKFSIQVDMIVLNTKDVSYSQVLQKIKAIKKSPYVVKIDENKYFVQIFTQSFEEYKQTLDKIWQSFGENLIDLEVHNTKDWLIINKHDFDDIKK